MQKHLGKFLWPLLHPWLPHRSQLVSSKPKAVTGGCHRRHKILQASLPSDARTALLCISKLELLTPIVFKPVLLQHW